MRTSAATGDATETRTAYDALGRVIAASMPRNPGDTSATGTASTTVTRYYGDGTNGMNNCTTATSAAAVVFAGMVCSTGPANVQVGGSAGLPTSTTTYTRTGLPATVTETLTPYGSGTNSTLRATTTGYDGADRPLSVRTTTYGALHVTAGTEIETLTYDDMGNPDSTSDGGSSNVPNARTLRTTYDTLGRVTSSLEATGLKTQTTYDTSGRVATTTITDTNTSPANSGAATITGYSPVTAGKVWKQTNSYDPITGDLTGTTDEAPSGQASAGAMSMTIDLDGRTVVTTAVGSGYTKKTVFDTTGAAVRRTVIAGGQTVLDEANAPTVTSNGGGENVYGQQVESSQQLKAITRNSAGEPSGTTASTTTRHRRYSYDGLGRLVAAADSRLAPVPNAMSCTVRAWKYDADSNQAARVSTPTSSSGPCAATGYTVPSTSTPGGNTLATHSMNALDQITDSGYAYDGLGRTLTVPASNGNLPDKTAAGATGSGLSVAYAPGDMVASQTLATGSGNEVQTFTLDPTGDRLLASTTTLPGQGATTVTNRYNDTDDNPALINEADGTVSRYVTGPDADLTAAVTLRGDGSSGLAWQVINLHGDVVATVPGGATATATAAVMTDEFGAVLDTTPGQNNTAASRYDWLGGKQRSNNARAGLTLMGVRLYNPATARFASVDPVPGGNVNAYTYPLDPVNVADTTGKNAAVLAGGGAIIVVGGIWIIATHCVIVKCAVALPSARSWTIPKPGGSRAPKLYYGYTIKDKKRRVYKYGITGTGPNKRPEAQLGRCRRKMGSICTYSNSGPFPSYWSARKWEYGKIFSYVKKHYHCPPGQYWSCK
ncbi:RHS repeat-associated core domain-containing protein [Kineococcus sp. LSe6-4]|uniref:RHS repeat-associated core domain-containing protein n=1 Tax=Kineococcus halophytocola TaxID=3234027 RepID=A0ABV4H5S6_9ACTN